MKASLPQNESEEERERRDRRLQDNADFYRYDHKYLKEMPLLQTPDRDLEFPAGENSSLRYELESRGSLTPLVANMLVVKLTSEWDPFDRLNDYEEYFPLLPRPDIIRNYETDARFAEQRLSGVNPLVIERIDALPDGFGFTLDALQKECGNGVNLAQLLAQQRLYLCDYSLLKNVHGGNYQRGRKFLPKTVALFAWNGVGYADRGNLVPVAIRLELDDNSLIIRTPNNCTVSDWFIAKTCVNIADGNHHEMCTHLCRTHLVMETFAVATGRHLADNHPLGLLLRPHFRFMLRRNLTAREELINQDGPVDKLLAGTLEESLQVVVDAYHTWSIKDHAFPRDIERRKMQKLPAVIGGGEITPHYPYRDDGQLLWEAISTYVGEYLGLYYQDAPDLKDDYELQNWAETLVSPTGGKVKDLSSPIHSLDELIELVTTIIFTCGPLHSAVNFSQYDYLAFTPNMPLAAYDKIPTPDNNVGRSGRSDPLLSFLPPPVRAGEQLQVAYALSAFRIDRLGDYSFKDIAAQEALERFRRQLDEIERKIDIRNSKRIVPYPYLKPSLILNSISI